MADPATAMAAIGLATTVAGGIVNAGGQAQQAGAQSQMFLYQAGVARHNSDIAKQNAEWAVKAGEVSTQQKGMGARARMGAITAKQSAGNLDVNFGSNVEVRKSQREVDLQDQALIRANAARRAFAYDVESKNLEAQGNIYEMSARNARTAGRTNVLSSLLGTASSVSSRWMQASQAGIGSSPTPSYDGPVYGPGY